MRCPRCSTSPPFDPFLCTTCGEHLLTYLDEPLGPGSGVGPRMPGPGVVGTMAGPQAAGFRVGQPRPGLWGVPDPAGPQVPQPGVSPGPPPRKDNTVPFILKLLFGLFVTMILLSEEPLAGFLFFVGLALVLWRWPRARLLPFGLAVVGIAAVTWVAVEVIDEIDSASYVAPPTPMPDYLATSTAVAVAGTPTLLPAARTATATVVAGQNRAKLSRARARWLRGDNDAALAELNEALTLMPNLAETLNLRALVRIAAGDYRGAFEDADRAVRAQPNNPTYRDTLAYAFLKLGQYPVAAQEYDRLMSDPRFQDSVAANLGRGIARTAQGQLVEARRDLETGLRLLPDTDPDPQLADLELMARRALDPLAPRPGSPSPVVSPVPAVTPGPRTP